MDSNKTLHANFIGSLFSTGRIEIENSSIVTFKKDRFAYSISLADITHFVTVSRGVFGAKITIHANGKAWRINFLRNSEVNKFVFSINRIIAKNIEDLILSSFDELSRCVVQEYPRDSKKDFLQDIVSIISSLYMGQKQLWHNHISKDLLGKVRVLVSQNPIDLDKLRKQHEERQLKKRRQFFDEVESNPLTLEQRLAVIRSNDRNMVLAAAGTGKTSVIVAKAMDLIDRKLADPSEILVLAYNRDAAEELRERLIDKGKKINLDADSYPQIFTFHALGRKLLRASGASTYMSVFVEDDLKLMQWISKWIKDFLQADISRVYDFIELHTQPIDPFSFESKADYERYVRDNEFRTLQGEKVKGYQELLIANFLYMNRIPYQYEAPYVTKRRIDIGFDYKPDFHLEGTNIYIEHFGIDRNGKTRRDIDSVKYVESMERKRILHKEYETVLIETFHYEWCDNSLLSGLEAKLAAIGIKPNPMEIDEVWNKLKLGKHMATWCELLKKSLQAIRVERLTKDQIKNRLESANIHRPEKYADLLEVLHQCYVAELMSQKAIDFEDMIIRTIHAIRLGKVKPNWKYILVDEFQDISGARMEFVQALIDKGPNPSLTVVGDDWQSIYRFSGGKLEFTTRFGEVVGTYTETKLQKTFRYNNSIAETAGQFIMENPEQFKKDIETHDKVDSPQIYLLDDKPGDEQGVYERALESVKKIREHDPRGTIAVIARYNYLLRGAESVISTAKLSKNVYFWSFHRAKGLEADYCILIGFFQGKSGFPNENRNEAIIEALLPSLDSYPHSEERRLLYVGLTRAKRKSYLIADPGAPSDFITELLSPKYKINIVSAMFQARYRKIFKCPNCVDGYFRLFTGKFNEFYSCSTGRGCDIGWARVCAKCRAPSVDTRDASVCNNQACRSVMKICQRCGRPMKLRDGKFGRFWGCSGYGIEEDRCKHTNKYSLS